jgi:F-box and leucine-rich repeat protein GRR1
VTSCVEVTDDSLIALAQSCLGLKELQLAECAQITDVGVTAVMQGCPRLEKLCVEECTGLTKRMERKINKRYPNSL